MLKHKKRKRKSFVLLLREAAASTAETWAHVSALFLLAVGCWKCSLQPTAVGCTEPGMELRDIGFRNKMVGHCCSKSSLKWGSIYWLSSPSCSPAAEVFGLRRYAFFHSAGLGLSTRIINSDYRLGLSDSLCRCHGSVFYSCDMDPQRSLPLGSTRYTHTGCRRQAA